MDLINAIYILIKYLFCNILKIIDSNNSQDIIM